MANFQTHLYGGILVGIVGMTSSIILNLAPTQTAPIVCFAGVFGGIAPDLDHDHGRPIRILFNISAIFVPMIVIFRIPNFHENWTHIFQTWCTLAFLIRFPTSWLFKRITTHRGIFHSIPASGIYGFLLYIFTAHETHSTDAQFAIAITGTVGYCTHLLLDELWSVDFNGVTVRLKKSSGTALTFRKKNVPITAVAYFLLFAFGYLVWLDQQGVGWFAFLNEIKIS